MNKELLERLKALKAISPESEKKIERVVADYSQEKKKLLEGKYFTTADFELMVCCGCAYLEKKHTYNVGFESIYNKIVDNPGWQNFIKAFSAKSENREVINRLKEIEDNYLLAFALFNSKLEGTVFSSKLSGVSGLAISLLGLSAQDEFLEMGPRLNDFLFKALIYRRPKQYIALYNYDVCMQINQLRLLMLEIEGLCYFGKNGLPREIREKKFDKIFLASTMIGQIQHNVSSTTKWLEANNLQCKDAWYEIITAWLHLKEGGKLVVYLNDGMLNNVANQDIRNFFVTNGLVEAVVDLPDKIIINSNLSMSLLVLSKTKKEKVNFVDASSYFVSERRGNFIDVDCVCNIMDIVGKSVENSIFIPISKVLEENAALVPKRYFIDTAHYEGIALEKLCHIGRGAPVISRKLEEVVAQKGTKYKYLYSRDIKAGTVALDELPSIDPDSTEAQYGNYLVKEKCILVTKNAPYKVALVNPKDGVNLLVNGNVYILRAATRDTNLTFIYLFLSSKKGLAKIESLSSGSYVKNISIKDLKNILIPKIDKKRQDNIVGKYNAIEASRAILHADLAMLDEEYELLMEGVV